eukprot:3620416-Prymnesium_polylepis.1
MRKALTFRAYVRRAVSSRRRVPATSDAAPPTITVEWDRQPDDQLGVVLMTVRRHVVFDQVRVSSVAYHLGIRAGMVLVSFGDEQLDDSERADELFKLHQSGTITLRYQLHADPVKPPRFKRGASEPAIPTARPTTRSVSKLADGDLDTDVPAEGVRVDV